MTKNYDAIALTQWYGYNEATESFYRKFAVQTWLFMCARNARTTKNFFGC